MPLEAMVFEYASLRGSMDGMDPTVITEIARYFRDEMGYDIPPQTPFVGENFNVTRAGIHADGLMKDEEIYNIFNTKKAFGQNARCGGQQDQRPCRHRLLAQRALRSDRREEGDQG